MAYYAGELGLIIDYWILMNPTRNKEETLSLVYIPREGLTSTCPKTEVKYHPTSIGVMCDQHVESPVVVGFLY